MRRFGRLALRTLLPLGFVALLVVLATKRQALQDWWRLHNYTPPAAVAQLAMEDTMTAEARHLFYVNYPVITSGAIFTSHCPLGSEKTVVLGCYVGADQGIYLYDVTDSRLQGVEQVTAAHEMLHAAYRRLPSGERRRIDTLLTNFYATGLTDQRIKDTIAAYKKSEPGDVVNEMHSVFGTEVGHLPAPLERYYSQYFHDRSKITAYTASYQAAFTSRQALIRQYDNQLQTLKIQINTSQAEITKQKAELDALNQQLQSERNNNQVAAYNSGVDSYNTAVNTYNALLQTTKDLISQYNTIVNKRNAVVLEDQQLTQELSANPLKH